MKEVIMSELGKIVGLKLQDAGRASNLFWLGFGDIIQIIRRCKTQESAEYALHIQCSIFDCIFRFCNRNGTRYM